MKLIFFLLLMIILLLLLIVITIIQANKNIISKLTEMKESIINYLIIMATKEFTKVKLKDTNKK